MASNEAAYGLKLAWHAIGGVATFAGRSRRTELFYYGLAAVVLSPFLGLLVDWALPRLAGGPSWRADRIFDEATELLLFIPCFALFARRLHDQDRSALWVLILPPLLALNSYRALRFILLDPQTGAVLLHDLPWWLSLAGAPLALALVTLAFLPGTNGPNRYGPDPRDDDPRVPRAARV